MDAAQSALADLKVLELGEYISAPFAAKMLGDMGAEVIKVEPPRLGDESRRQGPFPNDVPHLERSGLFLFLNGNKKSITLNLRTPTARDIVYELCKHVDAVIDNRLPREQQALGIDGETLRKGNPRLVVTSVTAYGHDGPYRDYKGYAINAAASSGVLSRIGHPERAPLTTPLSRSDYWGAINAAGATMAALFARRTTGCGQHVDISSAESMSAILQPLALFNELDGAPAPSRQGSRMGNPRFPWALLPCKDGFFSVMAGQGEHWSRFVELLGSRAAVPGNVEQPALPSLAARTKHDLWQLCRANGIPFHTVQNTADLAECPHLGERGFFVEIKHPEAGVLRYPGAPYRLSESPWRLRTPAPRLGQHNAEVLCGLLGFSKVDLVDLRRTGII